MTSPDPSFSQALTSIFRDLHTSWLQAAPEHMLITDERVLRELSLPPEAVTRIAYFSLPGELISLYRDSVFPLVEDAGLVPATGDETLSGGGGIQAMSNLLLERAWAVVADLSTGDRRVRRELRAARRRKAGRVQQITEDPAGQAYDTNVPDAIVRPPLTETEPNVTGVVPGDLPSWLAELGGWLDVQGVAVTDRMDIAARSFLERDDHRHALIAGLSVLENTLRRALRGATPALTQSATLGARLTMLLQAARERGTITEAEHLEIREAKQVRDSLVHRPQAVADMRAKQLAEAVLAVVKRLRAPAGAGG